MPDGKPVQRDYVDQISSAENGWRRAARALLFGDPDHDRSSVGWKVLGFSG
jgi:hypothetical protein